MEPNDLEYQQLHKNRKGKCTASHLPSWKARNHPEEGSLADPYWKYVQRNSYSVPHTRTGRKQEYPTADAPPSYYSFCKQQKQHLSPCPTLPAKYSQSHQPQHPDQSYHYSRGPSRATRNKLLTNNVAVIRKSHYKDDPEDEEDLKYAEDELGVSTEENAEDDAGEEDDEQEEPYDYPEKDYEEHEADDEIDDESDALPQPHRAHGRALKSLEPRSSQPRNEERRQESRHSRQRLPQKSREERTTTRCYRHGAQRDATASRGASYGDVPDVSEEEMTMPPTPPRNSTKRPTATRDSLQQQWMPQRRSPANRYDAPAPRPSSPSPLLQQNRRCRSTRAEAESFAESQLTPDPKICCLCDATIDETGEKFGAARKAGCRLQDCGRGFTLKVGDNGKPQEISVCGQCAIMHNMENLRSTCETSAAPISPYFAKPRRSRYPRSPLYEVGEDQRLADEAPAAYASAFARHPREQPEAFRERTRHSLRSFRGSSRRAPRYDQ